MVDLVSPSPMSSTEGDLNKDVIKAALGRTSIVITTHYIEEARQAHRVGMLRFGKLLEEGSPDSLLARYLSCTYLHDALQLIIFERESI